MADNLSVTPGTGAVVAAKDLGGGQLAQRVVPVVGTSDVSGSAPMPVTNPDARAFLGNAASTIGPFPVSTTSANAAISGLSAAGGQVRVANTGSSPVRIAWGSADTVAATTPTPGILASGKYSGGTAGSKIIPAGAVEVLSAPTGTAYVAFKTDAGVSTVEFTPGGGI